MSRLTEEPASYLDQPSLLECYECGQYTLWLAPDSRCCDCTRLSVEEVTGGR